MTTDKTPSLLNICGISLVIFLSSALIFSCFSKKSIVRYIDTQKSVLSENNITPLQEIPLKQLRNAHDNNTGSLYYAGLLWFFNDETERAIIAWKRSARTGVSPWKEESMRLVAYTLVYKSRYNQISPFIDSILNYKEIQTDPELFSYYAFALWKDKNYNQLSSLVNTTSSMPQFKNTIRQRISITQAQFNYTMWHALLSIQNDHTTANTVLKPLLTQYSLRDINTDIEVLLNSIPNFSMNTLSPHIQKLLRIRSLYDSNPEEAYRLLISLPSDYYRSPWIIQDIMRLTQQLSSSYYASTITLLKKIQDASSDELLLSVNNIFLAEMQYIQYKYTNSMRLYQRALQILPHTDYSSHLLSIINEAKWRYLYSILQVDISRFFPQFLEITKKSDTPEYFSNLLEECLSELLQRKQLTLIKQYYNTYYDELDNPFHKIELSRWQSILSQQDDNFPVDIEVLTQTLHYHSDTAFDYFINYADVLDIDTFLKDWQLESTLKTFSDIDRLVQGYIDFRLTSYGYKVVLENISLLHPETLVALTQALHNNDAITQSLTLIRIAAANDSAILNNISAFQLLYPTPYLDILQSITDSPIDQALFMAIMREESSFDHNVVSWAGAIGLSQLLPSTAENIAQNIGFEATIQLTNPNDNIILGYQYLQYLIRILRSPLKALASYNGGIGNVWKWEDTYNTDNLIIFADSLPFRETRNYVRKVATSAMIYGLLYFDVTPNEFQDYLFQ